MSWFVVIGGVLLLAILVVLLRPLLKEQGGNAVETGGVREFNLNILREQLAELEKDLQEGRLDQATYQQTRQELERRVLDDAGGESPRIQAGGRKIKLAIGLGILVPAVVVSLYMYLGSPEAMTGAKPQARGGAAGEHALSPEQIAGMVENLALRLQENPNDGQGWLMLGRSYAVLGRYPESAAAFSRAVGLLPPDAQHYADFADIVAMTQGKRLEGEPEKLVYRALEIDPNNIKALALAGTIAFDRQHYALAIREWRKVLVQVPEESAVAAGIQNSIIDAENRMAIAGKQAETSNAAQPAVVARVGGVVELDPALRAQVTPGDTLFVFARAVDGPKMPVAMLRKKVGDLPLQFTLDDSMSMTPQFKLSTVGKVVIGARISRSGDALARAGDLEGLSAPLLVGTENARILIGTTVK